MHLLNLRLVVCQVGFLVRKRITTINHQGNDRGKTKNIYQNIQGNRNNTSVHFKGRHPTPPKGRGVPQTERVPVKLLMARMRSARRQINKYIFIRLTILWEFTSEVNTLSGNLRSLAIYLRRWVPQERVTQLRIRLWSALVIFSFGCLNISDYMKFDIFYLSLLTIFSFISKILRHLFWVHNL